MSKLLDTPLGIAAVQQAACHEIERRLGRFFHRKIVIAYEEWLKTGTFNLETVVGDLNEQNDKEVTDYFTLLQLQSCNKGEPGAGFNPYVAYGKSEDESFTASYPYVQKLRVSFTAEKGVRYRIDWYFELYKKADEDVAAQVQINDSLTICEAAFKNAPNGDRWNDGTGGFYCVDFDDGTVDVDIDYRNSYGDGDAGIRRARILVTRVDGP